MASILRLLSRTAGAPMIPPPIARTAMALIATQSSNPIESATAAHNRLFLIYVLALVLTALLIAWLTWRLEKSSTRLSDAIQADASARIEEARRDAGNAIQQAGAADERAGKADERAGKADARAGIANAAAGLANLRAAEANQKAETERLARVKIEKELAPRTLNDADRASLGDELKQFAPKYIGRKISVSSYSGDAEGVVFSLELVDVLNRAGIGVESVVGRVVPVGVVDTGIKIVGTPEDEAFIRAFANGIYKRLDTDVSGDWSATNKGLGIAVCVKPVPGLPKVVTKKP